MRKRCYVCNSRDLRLVKVDGKAYLVCLRCGWRRLQGGFALMRVI